MSDVRTTVITRAIARALGILGIVEFLFAILTLSIEAAVLGLIFIAAWRLTIRYPRLSSGTLLATAATYCLTTAPTSVHQLLRGDISVWLGFFRPMARDPSLPMELKASVIHHQGILPVVFLLIAVYAIVLLGLQFAHRRAAPHI